MRPAIIGGLVNSLFYLLSKVAVGFARRQRRIIGATHLALLRLRVVVGIVQRDAADDVLLLPQVFDVRLVRLRLVQREADFVQNHLHRSNDLRFARVREIEELEQVFVAEVFLEGALVSLLLFAHHFFVIFDRLQIHTFLVHLPAVDDLFDSAAADHSVHNDILLLANTVAAINCLVVVGRIPVRVENDCAVSSDQIEAKATDLCRQQSEEHIRVLVVLLTEALARRDLRVAIDANVLEVLQVFFLVLDDKLEQIQHLFRHGEDQNTVALGLQLSEQSEEKLRLDAGIYQVVDLFLGVVTLDLFQLQSHLVVIIAIIDLGHGLVLWLRLLLRFLLLCTATSPRQRLRLSFLLLIPLALTQRRVFLNCGDAEVSLPLQRNISQEVWVLAERLDVA